MFGYKYNWFFAGLLGVYSFLNILILEGDRLYQVELEPNLLFTVILGISFAVWFGNFFIERIIHPFFPQVHPLIVQFFSSFVLAALVALISVEITSLIFGGPYSLTLQNLLLTGGFAFRINLFLNCVNAIFFFNSKFKQKDLEAERLKTLTVTAQVESLNAQLNPHFFFNNLNALSSLMHKNVDQADAYLQKLATIYRYLLKNRTNELVSLEDELKFLQSYLDLLQIRFDKSFQVEIELEKNSVEYLIAPAVLQLLVENIMKHNFFTQKQPLLVKIYQQDLMISVWNKKQKKQSVEPSAGIGLKNISERYAFLKKDILIQNEEEFFQVDIPLIEKYEDPIGRR